MVPALPLPLSYISHLPIPTTPVTLTSSLDLIDITPCPPSSGIAHTKSHLTAASAPASNGYPPLFPSHLERPLTARHRQTQTPANPASPLKPRRNPLPFPTITSIPRAAPIPSHPSLTRAVRMVKSNSADTEKRHERPQDKVLR